GQVPFRTTHGLDVLPVEGQVYYKRPVENPSAKVREYYEQLYASFKDPDAPSTAQLALYETLPFPTATKTRVDLGADTIDGSLWVALMVRANDKPYADTVAQARREIAGKTISLGVVPYTEVDETELVPGGGRRQRADTALLQYQLPKLPPGGSLPREGGERVAQYRVLSASSEGDVLAAPGVVQITLPSEASELELWNNLDPLEAGSDKFPPTLEDTEQNERVITWLRVTSTGAASAKLVWVGINAASVEQRARISGELLPLGTGEPDQQAFLSKPPVIAGSVRVVVNNDQKRPWKAVEDLYTAGPEVPGRDERQPPGQASTRKAPTDVFLVNHESGAIRFGDGAHGRRPPFGATIRADYDYGVGRQGNVGVDSISSAPSLPAGLKVSNPVPTWGGADAETAKDGERQITRYLQHRDRMVNAQDFETITLRTPGVVVGRVEVLPAFNPSLAPNKGGDAPGAVTLLVIPKYDPAHPDTPEPDRHFMDAVCAHVDARRLVTTEIFLRGPVYKVIWISVGIETVPGASVGEVREAVKREIAKFLSPLPPEGGDALDEQVLLSTSPQYQRMLKGWPLGKPVAPLELLAVASRVPGVLQVNKVYVADEAMHAARRSETPDSPSCDDLPVLMTGLELPRVGALSVAVGEALPISQLRGDEDLPTVKDGEQPPAGAPPQVVPVPVVPLEC
ncbi:MAG TPA: baseplate J/gp47 family protein, partial [Pyrinomonadaceae bacterium]|nr:baseplate J/gp47 family protein [Pyrinomonadaceae bacterium]